MSIVFNRVLKRLAYREAEEKGNIQPFRGKVKADKDGWRKANWTIERH